MAEEPRIYDRERAVSSIKGVGKLDSHMQKNETGSLSFNINRNQLEDLNVRPKTMKFLGKNIG